MTKNNNGNHNGHHNNPNKDNNIDFEESSNNSVSTLDPELDDLRKKFYFHIKEVSTQISDFELTITNLQKDFVEEIQYLQKDLVALQTPLTNLQNAQTQMQASISSLQTEQENVQDQLAELSSSQVATSSQIASLTEVVENITNVIIPNLEAKIDNGSGSGGKNWTVVYDKDSPDPEINKGQTEGLRYDNFKAAVGDFDITPYNSLRLTFVPGSMDKKKYEFDLEISKGVASYDYTILYVSKTGETFIIATLFQVVNDDGTTNLRMYSLGKLGFRNKQSPTFVTESSEAYYYSKIEVC